MGVCDALLLVFSERNFVADAAIDFLETMGDAILGKLSLDRLVLRSGSGATSTLRLVLLVAAVLEEASRKLGCLSPLERSRNGTTNEPDDTRREDFTGGVGGSGMESKSLHSSSTMPCKKC